MKKVTAYKCDHCSKASTSASAMSQHEKKCYYNPNNRHKCFDYCKHLERVAGMKNRIDFRCKVTEELMYSYKAEKTSIKTEGMKRMPLQCEQFEYMSWDLLGERLEI